jgi:hypothetical protein
MPPTIWEALLHETDIDIIIGSLNGDHRYNPAV